MDLELVATEELVEELTKRSETGLIVLRRGITDDEQDVDRFWWGDSYAAIGLAQNLCHFINCTELCDEIEDTETESEDEL